jgi:hypothetical protein
MKRFAKYMMALITIILILPPKTYAQNNSTDKEQSVKNILSITESTYQTHIKFPGGQIFVNELNDTISKITLGKRRYEIIEKPGSHFRIQMVHEPLKTFKGHWSGFDLGISNFVSTPFDSQLPENAKWMDLNAGRSSSVAFNLLQYSIGLQKNRSNLGLVTGAGWTINNYRLDSKNILTRDNDGQTTYRVSERNVEKNKLVTSFITLPVLLELQLPSHNNRKEFFISAGVYGSLRMGSHTKVVFNDTGNREKSKWREDLNLNGFKYGAMVRTGYKCIKIYAKCDLSQMFEAGRGPELYPWTIGVTLLQL